jgi:hypothetical protein
MSTLVILAVSAKNREFKVDIQGLDKISIKWILSSPELL